MEQQHFSKPALKAALVLCSLLLCCTCFGCAPAQDSSNQSEETFEVSDKKLSAEEQAAYDKKKQDEQREHDLKAFEVTIKKDFIAEFQHGEKPASCQKYIVLHDTESNTSPEGIVSYWDGNNKGIAAHFVVGKDGRIVQCVPLDKITHHSGFGDTGHNASYGVTDESRDDKKGTTPIGSWASDYGMNSYSIGIEMVHTGATDNDYPKEQLEALDKLIAYIDTYYGSESTIIDHKAWRTGNSDTSAAFAPYLANYQDHRSYK